MKQSLNFISFSDLTAWTNEWIKSFPRSYDLIVGIPRSGLLVANIIALKLAKPLATPDLFLEEQFWLSKSIKREKMIKSILLVDDSINSGKTMNQAAQVILQRFNNIDLTTAVLIATNKTDQMVDLYYKVVRKPRVFEWNLLHAKKGKGKIACDMDGVLCENCPPGVSKNKELYIQWLIDARPYLIPAFTIDAIVTSRMEKYRLETESWLSKHNVRYKELIMWDLQSKQDRKGQRDRHKIEVLAIIRPDIFWESSFRQATQIWRTTHIPTICIDKMKLISSR
jgi:uncharacterized HAD superfamily protein/hypoxanthine phosphoribosyltransferase